MGAANEKGEASRTSNTYGFQDARKRGIPLYRDGSHSSVPKGSHSRSYLTSSDVVASSLTGSTSSSDVLKAAGTPSHSEARSKVR